jgi:Holliday junction resolvasome RuvABC endonuclease subunit
MIEQGTRLLALDPGSRETGWVIVQTPSIWGDPPTVVASGKMANEDVRSCLRLGRFPKVPGPDEDLFAEARFETAVIEWTAPRGMPASKDLMETLMWVGRFIECLTRVASVGRVTRSEVKRAICGATNAKDTNVRRAILDVYGGDVAKGTKKAPGPLYGLKADAWQALALAVAWASGEAQGFVP